MRCHHGCYITRPVGDARDHQEVPRDAFRAHAAAVQRYHLRHARAVAAGAQDISDGQRLLHCHARVSNAE